MNNNLSASPTLDDLTDNTDDADDADRDDDVEEHTDNDSTLTWHCPYCNYTNTDLPNVRNHITDTIEGDHEGVSGWSPDEDIIATNDDGDEVRRIEGAGERPDEDHHLDHGEKRTLIINAWLENDQERDTQAFASILPASEQYIQRITKQLETGEIDEDEYRAEMDWDIRHELADRLENYYDQQNTSMSLSTNDDGEVEHGSKKQQIINAWLLDDTLNYTDLADVLPANEQYIGRVFRNLDAGDIDNDEIEDAADKPFQVELMNALHDNNVNVTGTPTTSIDDIDVEETDSDTPEDQPEYQETLEDASKKARILNSVIVGRALDVDFTNSEIAGAADSSTQYAQKLTKQIKDGDITDEELHDAADEDLQQALKQYYEEHNLIAPDTGDATVAIDLSNEDDPFENVPVSKREALVNVFLFDSDITKTNAGDLVGASAEYARQTYNGIQHGEYDPDEYLNEAIQNALAELEESGELDAFFAGDAAADSTEEDADVDDDADENVDATVESDDTSESTDSESEAAPTLTKVAETKTASTTEQTTTTDSTDTTRTPGEETAVPASELETIRDTAELLLEQAEYEGDNPKAEFIARRLRDDLDELLDDTQ